MAIIAIRHEFATGGRTLGRLIAEKTGYRIVDKYVFQQIAETLSVSEAALESFEKSRHYYFTNMFTKLISENYLERIVGHDRTVVSEMKYQESLQNLIQEIALNNNVVIVGRASCYFLKDFDDCYRVRVLAPMEWRSRYAVEKLSIPAKKVKNIIAERDKIQKWFLRMICGSEIDDRHLFHISLNMEIDSFSRAAEAIMAVAGISNPAG